MFAQEATTNGYRVCVLEKDPHAPAATVCAEHIVAEYTNPAALKQLAEKCKAVTTEFENVPASSLECLAKSIFVAPGADAVNITQDRYTEKSFVASCGVRVAPHKLIESDQDVEQAEENLFPAILKTARLGYDGKGQVRIKTKGELAAAFEKLGRVRCVLEKMLPLHKEVSVISARNGNGESCTFPVSENQHQNGILSITILPARVSDETAAEARSIAKTIVDRLDYKGVLCVEFFVLKDGSLVVNELAPRPHNSGHATIEACVTSQFGQQLRAMTSMPLGSTELINPAVMINLLGDLWFDENGNRREPAWDEVLKVRGAYLHLYGKLEPRKGRKMGHITCIGKTQEETLDKASRLCRFFGLPSPLSYSE